MIHHDSILGDLTIYGEEFTIGNGETACLLVHGLGCGPIQMRGIGENLRNWGFTARGILLPGHCKNIHGFTQNPFYDWQMKIEKEYRELKQKHSRVIVIGFSLGALLTLQLATKYPIERIVLIGTPVFLVHKYLPIRTCIRICKNFVKRVKTRKRKCYMESERYSGYLHQPIETHYSLHALNGITEIIDSIVGKLMYIKSPALVIHSKKDAIAAPASATYVIKRLGSTQKELIWLKKSHHLVMYDNESDVMINSIKEFLLI